METDNSLGEIQEMMEKLLAAVDRGQAVCIRPSGWMQIGKEIWNLPYAANKAGFKVPEGLMGQAVLG
jgi:hypothetical protein